MLDLLSDPPFPGTPLLSAVRYFLCALLFYNMFWSFRGVCDLFKETHFVVATIRSAIFLTCSGLFCLQLLVLIGLDTGSSSIWALVSFGLLLGGQALLIYYHLAGFDKRVARFFYFYPHIEKALPIIELAGMNPEQADRIHQHTLRVLVRQIMQGPPGRIRDTEDHR